MDQVKKFEKLDWREYLIFETYCISISNEQIKQSWICLISSKSKQIMNIGHTSSTTRPSNPSCKVVGTFIQGEDWASCEFTPKAIIVGRQYFLQKKQDWESCKFKLKAIIVGRRYFLQKKLVNNICKERGSNVTKVYQATS